MSRLVASQRAWLAPSWVREELSRKAQALPSLDLRFAESKSLTDAASGANLVTFTRASSGTYVGSDGLLKTATTNEPRFDHNPTTGESLGLLVEESRTNLLLRSEEFGSTWSTTNAAVAADTNETVSPAGANTADKLTSAAGTAIKAVFQGFTSVTGTYTFSVYAKKGTHDFIQFFYGGTGVDYANFNIATGATGTTVGTSSIISVGNSWYRCVHTFTASSNNSANIALIDAATSARAATSTNTNSIYLWGAQLEAGSFPTSYIPTTTATATRSADVASITGTNFSSWYRQDEGTVFADVNSAPVNNIAQLTFDISEGVGNERMFQRRSGSGMISTAVIDNGVTQGDIGSVVISASARYRSSFAYKLNDLEIVVNGGSSATDTSATMPTPDRLHIGQNYASGQSCNGTLRRLTFWSQRLPSSTLQAITQ